MSIIFASRLGERLELTAERSPYENDQSPAWRARAGGNGLNCELLCPEAAWQQQGLAGWLADLAADAYSPWEGDRAWQSGEGEIVLAARHELTSAVTFRIRLENGAPPSWAAKLDRDGPRCSSAGSG